MEPSRLVNNLYLSTRNAFKNTFNLIMQNGYCREIKTKKRPNSFSNPVLTDYEVLIMLSDKNFGAKNFIQNKNFG